MMSFIRNKLIFFIGFSMICLLSLPQAYSQSRGFKGEIESVHEDRNAFTIRRITNKRYDIFELITVYVDNQTVIIKRNKNVKLRDLSDRDIVLIEIRRSNRNSKTAHKVKVVDSWP